MSKNILYRTKTTNKFALVAAATLATTSAFVAASDDNKSLVNSAMNSIFVDFDQKASRALLSDSYIQHNPSVPTGPEPLIGV